MNPKIKEFSDRFLSSDCKFVSKINSGDFPEKDLTRFLDNILVGDKTYKNLSELCRHATLCLYDEKYSELGQRLFGEEDKFAVNNMLRSAMRDMMREYLLPSRDGFKHSMSFFSNPIISKTLSLFSELNDNKFTMINLGNIPETVIKTGSENKKDIYYNGVNIGNNDDPLMVLTNIASLTNQGTIRKTNDKLCADIGDLHLVLDKNGYSDIQTAIEKASFGTEFQNKFRFKENKSHEILNNLNAGHYFTAPILSEDSGVVTGFDTYNMIIDVVDGNAACYIKAVEKNALDLTVKDPISYKVSELNSSAEIDTIDIPSLNDKMFKEQNTIKGIEL